jgi:hypothetical protein
VQFALTESLVGEDLIAERVPALVEEMHVADFLNPYTDLKPQIKRKREEAKADSESSGGEFERLCGFTRSS